MDCEVERQRADDQQREKCQASGVIEFSGVDAAAWLTRVPQSA